MTDAEVGIYGFERPRPSGNDCSLSAPALTKQGADGQNPGSGEGREGNPKFATLFSNAIILHEVHPIPCTSVREQN